MENTQPFNSELSEYIKALHKDTQNLVYACLSKNHLGKVFDAFHDNGFKVIISKLEEWDEKIEEAKRYSKSGFPRNRPKFVVWLIEDEDIANLNSTIKTLVSSDWRKK